MRRIAAAALVAFSIAALMPTRAQAQSSWPERPVKFVVHVAAGGGFDLMARILAERLSQQLAQPVIVENQGGGGGTVAARQVARAAADGYTFLFVGPGHASLPYMYKQPAYDPIKDFVPVSLVTRFPQVLVVKPSLPAKNLTDFIALAKAEPGKLTFGSSGVGGAAHIPAEMFMHLTGTKMIHVPFRGNGPAGAALLGGQIDALFDGIAPQLGNIGNGSVRLLGVTTKDRSPFLPDAPAIAEIVPGYQYPLWTGLFAPADTPKSVVERLAGEIGKAMKEPAVAKRYTDLKLEAIGSNSAEFDTFFREQLKFNDDVIRRSNIQIE
jgi:tripartite-type tricarboxylate transporter receptor subunit TctC